MARLTSTQIMTLTTVVDNGGEMNGWPRQRDFNVASMRTLLKTGLLEIADCPCGDYGSHDFYRCPANGENYYWRVRITSTGRKAFSDIATGENVVRDVIVGHVDDNGTAAIRLAREIAESSPAADVKIGKPRLHTVGNVAVRGIRIRINGHTSDTDQLRRFDQAANSSDLRVMRYSTEQIMRRTLAHLAVGGDPADAHHSVIMSMHTENTRFLNKTPAQTSREYTTAEYDAAGVTTDGVRLYAGLADLADPIDQPTMVTFRTAYGIVDRIIQATKV